ncbi:hypothetical protein BC833DRAFT_608399 [Globomyces pollinis-pini]|nr:hypothetical protein BC833DRAFT_608399 [Globomyces pollinis-pini]
MAPTKTRPVSIKNKRGIIFSLKLNSPSKPQETTYKLNVDILNVTSTSLIHLIDVKQASPICLTPDATSPSDDCSLGLESIVSNQLSTLEPTSSVSLNTNSPNKKSKPMKRQKVTKNITLSPGQCTWCGTLETAQWRKGPTGARGLCNRCGIEWSKQIREVAKTQSLSTWDAELKLKNTYHQTERFKRFAREHLEGGKYHQEHTLILIT